MDNKNLEFFQEFNEEVKQFQQDNEGVPTNAAFEQVFLSYLTETEVTSLADCTFVNFKKDSENVRLDGYSYNEYFQSLSLLIGKFDPKHEPEMLWKKDIDKYLNKALKFYKLCDSDFFQNLEESSDGYNAYEFILSQKKQINVVNVFFITNDIAKNYIPEDIHYKNIIVRFDVWDIERLYRSLMGNNIVYKPLVIRLKNKYKCELPMIKVDSTNDIYDCYVGIISGELLAKIYKDEGQDLIQKNVRSYLQAAGKVNKGIKNSLQNEPKMFMAYNNGISTIADSIAIDEKNSGNELIMIKEISGWQIVNGGQTTASIYNAYQNKLPLNDVNVQVKLSVIKNIEKSTEIAANISKYANSQNKINMSDFNANDEYHIQMEKISRRTYIPVEKGKESEQWFYERARGQYMVELDRQPTLKAKKEFKERIPKNRCVSKTVVAKCLMTYMGYPYYVSKGLESNFVYFSDMIKEDKVPKPDQGNFIDIITKVILFNDCDAIVAKHNYGGYKAQINYYVIALIGKYYDSLVDTQYIWKNQRISPELYTLIDEELADKVWNHFQNPAVPGVNISQWCKKEECWHLLKSRFENGEL
jgi:hypothetical protein